MVGCGFKSDFVMIMMTRARTGFELGYTVTYHILPLLVRLVAELQYIVVLLVWQIGIGNLQKTINGVVL